MPRRIPYQLQWSSSTQEYIVFHDGRPVTPKIVPACPHWFAWLEMISSFSFQSRSGGDCTVRKETVQRGGTYWYAYRRKERRMMKRYLARDLTLARLEMVTAALNDAEAFSGADLFAATEVDAPPRAERRTKETRATPSAETATPPQLLLMTRLHIPRLPVQHVLRPRLLTLLQQGIQGPVTLVSAPAGSGKTTLLAEWASTTELPVAWISLEPADNDPSRFLSYLMAALASLDTRIDTAPQPANAQNPEYALTGILNDLTRLLQQEAVVILDDYHLLTTDAVHSLLRFLLDHLPAHLHLIIGTRVDPPLPLARLRAHLFVSALDDAENWYRYHPLFAETLRAHLQKLEPELIPGLYLRASRWYEQHQDTEEACDYALLAGDFPRAVHLVTELLPQMVEQGRFEQLGRWLDQLPPALIAASPQLSIATPWMHPFSQGSPEHMEQAVKRMEQHMQKQHQDASDSWVEPQSVLALFQALTAMSQHNLPRAFSLIHKALHALTRRDTALSQLISRFLQISLSVMYGASGDLATAEQILLDLSLMQPTEPSSVIHLAALFLLGELYKAQGQLRKGEALYESPGWTFESHSAIPPLPLLVVGFSLLRKTSLLYEWNRLPEAINGIQQVLEILPRGSANHSPLDPARPFCVRTLGAGAHRMGAGPP